MSESLPLVSIVIPAYNGESFLEESVRSVLEQDYPNIELLVFDDGSSDGTAELLKSYGDRFYWESHENIGQSATLNKGWRMATGEILSYLSVDDILEPEAVRESVKALEENPDVIMTYGDYSLIDENGQVLRQVKAPDFNYKEMLSKIIVQPGPGVFFRKKGFEDIGGWDTSLRQVPDFEYWIRLGLKGEFKHLHNSLARFRVHEGSQSFAETSVEKAEECVRVIESFFDKQDISSEINKLKNTALSSAHVIAFRFHIRAGRYRTGLSSFMQGIACDWRSLFSVRTYMLMFNAVFFRLRRMAYLLSNVDREE